MRVIMGVIHRRNITFGTHKISIYVVVLVGANMFPDKVRITPAQHKKVFVTDHPGNEIVLRSRIPETTCDGAFIIGMGE